MWSKSVILHALADFVLTPARQSPEPVECLREVMAWLGRAQDATPDRGVSRAYNLKKGWEPSYPETTGYITPTLIAYWHHAAEKDFFLRALHMAEWLLNIQLDCGAIPSGTVAEPNKVPTVFNTGMVIFAWLAAWRESGDQSLINAACRAGHWLCSIQDNDGAWRKGGSSKVLNKLNTYNTRVAWALAKLGTVCHDSKFLKCAQRNLNWSLSQQLPNGWFKNNDFRKNNRPWIHTISYATRGLLEGGILLKNEEYIEAARRSADSIMITQKNDGRLAARYTPTWDGEQWGGCLPGHAQVAIIWYKLGKIVGHKKYINGANRTLIYLTRHVRIKDKHPGIRGALKGSHPIWRRYGKFQYPNWGAKFLADALMLHIWDSDYIDS